MKKVILLAFVLILLSTGAVVSLVRPVVADGTIYIMADGSVDPPTAPIQRDGDLYAFIDNIYESIIVQRSNIVIDGSGYLLQQSFPHGWGIGFNLTGISNVTIKNTTIKYFGRGVYLSSSNNNIIYGNNIKSNNCGIRMDNSSHNSVYGNNVTYGSCCVMLRCSSNNTFRDNHLAHNTQNFGVYGNLLSHFINDIDASNTVGGKPIIYWVNRRNSEVPSDAGFVALVNCTRITVRNLHLGENSQGIVVAFTSNSSITQNNIYQKWGAMWDGVYLYNSSDIIISGNSITNSQNGIRLIKSSYNILSLNNITSKSPIMTYSPALPWVSSRGVYVSSSHHNTISKNNIKNVYQYKEADGSVAYVIQYGVYADSSHYNTISENNITSNDQGIRLSLSSYNTISGNSLTKSRSSVRLESSSSNRIYHNSITRVSIKDESSNTWDDGYPSGGNYWSDYNGTDLLSGPYQNEPNSDGISDSSRVIDANNTDNYPLMSMFSDFSATLEYHVQTICNSSISDFQFNGTAICFNVTGENGTTGFCRICIPTALMNETYKVFVNGTEVLCNLLPCSNSTHSYLYFTYNHSTQEVIIITEFRTWTSTLLVLIVFTVAIAIYKQKLLKTPVH